MKKLGRPKMDDSKTVKITVKIKPSQKEGLDKYCEKNRKSIPDAVREAIDHLISGK